MYDAPSARKRARQTTSTWRPVGVARKRLEADRCCIAIQHDELGRGLGEEVIRMDNWTIGRPSELIRAMARQSVPARRHRDRNSPRGKQQQGARWTDSSQGSSLDPGSLPTCCRPAQASWRSAYPVAGSEGTRTACHASPRSAFGPSTSRSLSSGLLGGKGLRDAQCVRAEPPGPAPALLLRLTGPVSMMIVGSPGSGNWARTPARLDHPSGRARDQSRKSERRDARRRISLTADSPRRRASTICSHMRRARASVEQKAHRSSSFEQRRPFAVGRRSFLVHAAEGRQADLGGELRSRRQHVAAVQCQEAGHAARIERGPAHG